MSIIDRLVRLLSILVCFKVTDDPSANSSGPQGRRPIFPILPLQGLCLSPFFSPFFSLFLPSQFTSAFDRIHARWQQVSDEMGNSVSLPAKDEADAWLAPVALDERAIAYQPPATMCSPSNSADRVPSCNPIGAARISNKGFLPMTRDQYLSLLDTLGRVIREGKRGFIPADLPPILERLDIEPHAWLDSFLDLFRSRPAPRPSPGVVGSG